MQASELIRPWTESLTTAWVGSLSLLVPAVTKIDPDGTLSFHFGGIPEFFKFADGTGTFGGFVLAVMFIGFLIAIGAIMIHFGEFLALLPDYRKGLTLHRKRIEVAGNNSAYGAIYANSSMAFRLLCGMGTFLISAGGTLIFKGLVSLSVQTLITGTMSFLFGLILIFVFARYAFSYLDWLIAGEWTP